MASKKLNPAKAEKDSYTSAEVQIFLNNATKALLGWDKLARAQAPGPESLRDFANGIVEALTEEVLIDPDKPGQLIIEAAYVALTLQAAAALVLYKFECFDEFERKTFLQQLIRGT